MKRVGVIAQGIEKKAFWFAVVSLLLTALLSYPARYMAPSEVASTSPDDPIFQAQAALKSHLSGPVHVLTFVVEDPRGDLWSPSSLRALDEITTGLRESRLKTYLWRYESHLYQQSFLGLLSPSDLVKRSSGEKTLETIDDDALKILGQTVATQILESPSQLIIPSGKSEFKEGRWHSPALIINILADLEKIGGRVDDIQLNRSDPPEERFAREVLETLRLNKGDLIINGVALDVNLSTQEQGQRSGIYIAAALFSILLLLGWSLRSYWALTLIGVGLATLMIWIKGINHFIGLKSDPILSLIVPIAMISFGVDAGVHTITRYQEEKQKGSDLGPSLHLAFIGTLGAITLAASTDLCAFLVNLFSDLESIRQFGLASAIALTSSFFLLGVLSPALLSSIERWTNQKKSSVPRALITRFISIVTGTITVMMVTFVEIELGLLLYIVYVLFGLVLPILFIRIINNREHTQVSNVVVVSVQRDEIAQTIRPVHALHDHESPLPLSERILSSLAEGINKHPLKISLTAFIIWIIALPAALGIRVEFDIRHLLSPSSEFVQGLDHLDEHLAGRGGEPSSIYIEGPLAHPQALKALQNTARAIRLIQHSSLVQLSNGETRLDAGLIDLVVAERQNNLTKQVSGERSTLNSELLLDQKLISKWLQEGVKEGSSVRWAPDEIATMVWIDTSKSKEALWISTRFEVQLAQTQSSSGIEAANQLLSTYLVWLDTELKQISPEACATLTGGAISRQAELDAISASMQQSIPLALALCLLIVSVVLRSLYDALCCLFTLIWVVTVLYATMSVFDYGLNFMSATLGALSIGVGIDFATHTIVRMREELEHNKAPLIALQSTLQGTGRALFVSAGSSIIGFLALALSPMPLFSAYGFFTALMIGLSCFASVTLLPTLLLLAKHLIRS